MTSSNWRAFGAELAHFRGGEGPNAPIHPVSLETGCMNWRKSFRPIAELARFWRGIGALGSTMFAVRGGL